MTRHILFRILAGLVLLAAIAGIAYLAFNAGMAYKFGANGQLPAAQSSNPPTTYGHGFPFWRPFGFFGFGCFIPLVALFLLCLAFSTMRRMIWGPRWGWHHMHHHGPWDEDGPRGHHGPWDWKDEKFVPPMFREWHRRSHETPSDKTSEDSGK